MRRGDVAIARLKSDFKKWLDEPLASFNSWRVESWRRERLKAGTSPVTVNRQLDSLRSCLAKAVTEGVIDKHPLKGFKRLKPGDDQRVRYLSADEEKRLRAALATREDDIRGKRERFNEWRIARRKAALPARPQGYVDNIAPLVLIAFNSGLRRGELFSLRWSDIDLHTNNLVVRAAAAKSGKRRDIPLNDEAQQVLKNWRKQCKPADGDLVFPGAEGARMTNVNKSWATICKLAKLTNFRFHDLRHAFASKLVQRGVDLNKVRALLGHADLTMTLRYSHLTPGNLSEAVAKLGT
jgi:integrase